MLGDLIDRLDSGTQASASATIIALGGVLFPLLATGVLWGRLRPDRRQRGAIVLATTWNAVWLLALNVVAVQVGWWEFHNAGPSLAGVSVMLWLGWVVMWGALASSAVLLRVRPVVVVAVLAAFDFAAMPLLGEVLTLGPGWLLGETILLACVAWPGLLLARWTNMANHINERVVLQFAMFTAMLLWLMPFLSVTTLGRSLSLNVPTWAYGAVLFSMGGAALPAIIAIADFADHRGTPWPWDTTEQPVRSGPYRYVRSPMQASATLVLVVTSFLYGEPIILVAAFSTVLYSRLFCQLEAADLGQRFGSAWSDLALTQRRWIPTWQPSRHGEAGTIWVDAGCERCAPLGDFLAARSPTKLTICNAIDYPERLSRVRYVRGDGKVFDGVRAVGASLEHLHFGWASLGWLLRVSVLWRLWQLIGDAVGFGPRQVDTSGRHQRSPTWSLR